MGAFVLPAVQLGLGALGGLFGRKRRKQLEKYQTQGFEGMGSAGGGALNLGEQGSQQGLETLGAAGDFYKKLMGGDPQFLNELTGGGMSDMSKSLAQQRSFVSRMGTRGGGGAAAIAEAPAKLQSSIRGLQLSGRLAGAEGASNVGGKLGDLGLGGYQVAGSIFGNMAGGAGRALGDEREQSGAFGRQLGGAFGKPIADQLGKWFPSLKI